MPNLKSKHNIRQTDHNTIKLLTAPYGEHDSLFPVTHTTGTTQIISTGYVPLNLILRACYMPIEAKLHRNMRNGIVS
jgi:hypothetical protein